MVLRMVRARAPKLPPTSSTCSGPLRKANLVVGSGTPMKLARKGLPTHSAFFKTWGNAVNTRLASTASTLLAMPATEFCSCSTRARPLSAPTKPAGKVM